MLKKTNTWLPTKTLDLTNDCTTLKLFSAIVSLIVKLLNKPFNEYIETRRLHSFVKSSHLMSFRFVFKVSFFVSNHLV